MADKKVQIDILADAKNFQKGVSQASQSASTLEKALKKLGPVGSVFQNVIDKIGLSSVTSAAGIAGGITAALGASLVIAEKSVRQFAELGEKIRSYSVLTGESAEASSRQVQAFQELGVAEDVAALGMFRLARQVESAPEKLKAVGIEVAHTVEGNVDLNGTLLNVIRAYQGTSDAGKRAAIVFAAFGKAGATMIPILEANAAQLERLEKQVTSIYTQADLDRVRQYQIAQKELQRSQDDLGNSIGRTLLPAWLDNVQAINENIYVNEHLDQAMKDAGVTSGQSRAATMQVAQSLREQYRASLDAQTATDSLVQAQKEAADAAAAEAKAEDSLYNSLLASRDAEFAYTQAQIDETKAVKDARDAKFQDREANLRAFESLDRLATAAVNYREKQAEANGATLSAAEKAQIYRQTLLDLEKTLGPNDPLRKEIQALIDDLNRIPRNVSTTISVRGISTAGGGAHGNLSFDEGGVVPGPTGAPVPAIVHGGEEVIPVGGRRGATELHIHIDRGAFIDGPSIDRLANLILQRARYAPGS